MTRMRQAARQGQRENVLLDAEETILGVDTHKDTHVAAVITILGALAGTRSFPGNRRRLPAPAGLGAVVRRDAN